MYLTWKLVANKFKTCIGDLAAPYARKIMMRCYKLLEKKGKDKYHQETRKLLECSLCRSPVLLKDVIL